MVLMNLIFNNYDYIIFGIDYINPGTYYTEKQLLSDDTIMIIKKNI